MPIDLTRRWFLIGSAAAISASVIGIKAAEPFARIVSLKVPYPFRIRKIFSIGAMMNNPSPVRFLLTIDQEGEPLFDVTLGAGGSCRWVCDQDREIVQTPSSIIRISVEPFNGSVQMEIGSEYEMIDHKKVDLAELYNFSDGNVRREVMAMRMQHSALAKSMTEAMIYA